MLAYHIHTKCSWLIKKERSFSIFFLSLDSFGLRGEAYGAVPEVLGKLREVEAIGPGRGEHTAIALGAGVFLRCLRLRQN